jgi:hypothetical protein
MSFSPEAEKFFVFPRECDANRASAHPSWWMSAKCFGEPPLPAECEKAGTYNLPSCQMWIISRAIQGQELEDSTDAALGY